MRYFLYNNYKCTFILEHSSIKFTIKRPLPRHFFKVAEKEAENRELKAEAKANPKPELNPNAAHSL